ncbi:MAG TPA: glycosyltransferase [Solirubrobacteraceae bacterium]
MSDAGFEPLWVSAVEVACPIEDLAPPVNEQGLPFTRARLLILVHGTPVGFVRVPLEDGRLPAAGLVEAVNRQIGPHVAAHLRADGLPAATLGPQGFEPVEDAPCTRCGPHPERAEGLASVIVCTRDRAAALEVALRGILTSARGNFEVVVVDNAPSTSATRDVVEALGDARLRYVLEPRPGLSRARNRGVQEAAGDLLVFTDDDVRIEPGWLGALLGGLTRAPTVGCVSGPVFAAELATPSQLYFESRVRWSELLTQRIYDLDANRRDDPMYPYSAGHFGTGANFAADRATWVALGGMDPLLGTGTSTMGGEDLDFFLRVLLSGRALAIEPRAVVWHYHRRDADQLPRQMYGYGVGLAAYACKHLLSPRTGPAIARRFPAALRTVAQDSRGTSEAAEVELDLSSNELRGLLAGGPRYLASRVRARRAGGGS